MDQLAILFSLFVMGLVSSAHCLGMCGGIMGALSLAIPAEARGKRWLILVFYNLGRIGSYALMGFLAGFFSEKLQALIGSSPLRILAGAMMVAMGLYLADWWRGLATLEKLGRYLWVYIQPWGKTLMPVTSASRALLLGGLWGWLPCGLVYAALASALTQPAPLLAAGAMLAFGLGTLPAVLAAGVMAQPLARVLQRRPLRLVLAAVVMLLGLWVMWAAVSHSHHNHSASEHSGDHSHANNQNAADNSEVVDHEHMHHELLNHAQSASVSSANQRTDEGLQIPDNDKTATEADSAAGTEEHHHHH